MKEETQKILISNKQAAEMMGYTIGGLRMRRLRKQPPIYYKVGGKILYDLEDIKAFIQIGQVVPQEEVKQDD